MVDPRLRVSVDPPARCSSTTTKISTATPSPRHTVTVPLPANLDIDPARWAYGAALVNPHATISVTEQADDGEDADPIIYKSAGQGWSKWTPSSPSSPHWYDTAAFLALVYSYIHEHPPYR